MPVRPNILLITSDQQRADCFGFENAHIKTPHLDRLAREGTRFSACITPNLVCQPSRASILTGQLPLTHGVWDNGVDLDPAVGERGFAGTLARAGYATALIGKAHFSTKATFNPTGTPECGRSGAQYSADWRGPYMGFGHVELATLGHFDNPMPLERPPVGHYERWLLAREAGEEALRLHAASAGPDTGGAAQTWHSALPPAWHSSTWIGDRAINWLNARDKSKPFCLWASFPDPHQPFDCPAPWSLMYDPRDVVLPQHRARDLDNRPWWYRASLEGNRNLLLRIRDRERKLVSKIDEAIGRIEDGSYGKCEECGGDIGIERLKARPVTTLCIDCKSLQETQERKLRLQ